MQAHRDGFYPCFIIIIYFNPDTLPPRYRTCPSRLATEQQRTTKTNKRIPQQQTVPQITVTARRRRRFCPTGDINFTLSHARPAPFALFDLQPAADKENRFFFFVVCLRSKSKQTTKLGRARQRADIGRETRRLAG